MQKCLVLHWRWWSDLDNWFPWLKDELEKQNIVALVPNLPYTDIPVYEQQLEFIEKYNDILKKWDIIVWHSLGCTLAMAMVDTFKLKYLKLILIAPPYPWLWEDGWVEMFWEAHDSITKYFNQQVSFEKLWNKYTAFLSDNDPFIDIKKSKKYLSKLENIEFIDFKNKWHFNQSWWTYELPEILDYIK